MVAGLASKRLAAALGRGRFGGRDEHSANTTGQDEADDGEDPPVEQHVRVRSHRIAQDALG